MQRLLFIVLFSIVNINVFAQDIATIKALADVQYDNQNYQLALKEYQRVFFFDQDKKYDDIYIKIARIYKSDHNHNEALKYYNYAWKTEPNDSIKKEIVFEKVQCYLSDRNYLMGLNELFDLPESDNLYFKNKQNLYFAICYFGLDDFNESEQYFLDITDQSHDMMIVDAFDEFEAFRKKYNPERIEKMSKYLPGLGQFYLGDWKNGLNSILLIGAILTYTGYTVATYGIIDGLLVMSSWFNRYYSGGYNKAKLLAVKKIERHKAGIYKQVLAIVDQQLAE
ncbi:MAG: hypothetical protein CR968_00730 [Flavobacteriia bacterium]|nr:MAG: hypothetical protein CR968_00730 [Flavobacteriia bacterium]